jgi:cobalamin biosynthesis Mg chelatase CobN
MIKKKQNFKSQSRNLLMLSTFLMLFVVGLGTLNYVENNNYILNKALAADETPVNPGGGGLDIPKSTTSTSSTATSTSTTGSSATGSNTTSSTNTSATTTTSTTTSTTGSASSSTSSASSTSGSGSTTSTESPGDGKTPGALPNGESDVLVIGKDKTITSQTSTPQTVTPVQNPASQIPTNAVTNSTVRSGGLEVTLASIAVIILAGYAYYYRKHVHTKGGLKTAEKKIHSK